VFSEDFPGNGMLVPFGENGKDPERRKEEDSMTVRESAGKKKQPSRTPVPKRTAKKKPSERNVKFSHSDPAAGEVCLGGDFNNWDVRSNPLKRNKQGIWSVTIKLLPGRYEYNFFVDGHWVQDEFCVETVTNPFGTQNSVIMVA
jgi:1,4-alpha-glucan branching enzyme